jgi:hypothetical protein
LSPYLLMAGVCCQQYQSVPKNIGEKRSSAKASFRENSELTKVFRIT